MQSRSFAFSLSVFALLVLIGVLMLEQIDPSYASSLSVLLIGFSVVLNVIVYTLAQRYSEQSDDKKYLSLVFKNFMLKLLVVIAIPFAYIKMGGEHNDFIIPYVLVYISFTIFETFYLYKTAIMRR